MPRHQPECETRCSARFRALLASRWLTCSSLLMLLTGCGTQVEILRPDPPPAELVEACAAGPDYPPGPARLGDVLEVVAAREAAAADCRARHRALSGWAKGVAAGQ
jgi:hypothetical protein